MNLNLFEDRKMQDGLLSKFIEELRKALNHEKNEKQTNQELAEYEIYEKKKIFLDNQTRKGNILAWVMDENSVCISEEGDGGPTAMKEVDLPKNAQIGEVYEKIDGKYCYNEEMTEKLSKLDKIEEWQNARLRRYDEKKNDK